MNEREHQEWQDREAARQASRSKWGDSQAVIEDGDLKHFSGPEITSLANAGRLVHMGIGPDRRSRPRA